MTDTTTSRREFLLRTGVGAAALASGSMLSGTGRREAQAAESVASRMADRYPIGIELYGVRTELARDLPNTLRTVAQMGYHVVEFYAPYMAWTLPYAKEVRTMLEDDGLRCFSTHNSFDALAPGSMNAKAIELNQILGARHIIVASPPANTTTADDWKRACAQFTTSVEQLKAHGLFAGFHNHKIEWLPLPDGQRVMDIIATNTPRDFILQLDVGTCIEAGAHPIAWINANPGRIRSVHLKDWAPGTVADEKGYRVLFGEGVAPWKQILSAVESVGGVEYYLMEQEGSRYSEFETAKRCLASWRTLRGV